MDYFSTSLNHLIKKLEWIDLVVQAHASQFRHLNKEKDEFRGLYVSEQEVEFLLTKPIGSPRWINFQAPVHLPEIRTKFNEVNNIIRQKAEESKNRGIELRFCKLSKLFGLDEFEENVLLLTVAPEIDTGYERIYAYLQDDITKKWPSVELVLNLLSFSLENKIHSRQYFQSNSTLIQNGIVSFMNDNNNPVNSSLSRYLKVDKRVAEFLLDSDEIDAEIDPYSKIIDPQIGIDELFLSVDYKEKLKSLVQKIKNNPSNFLIYLYGLPGTGKQTYAEAYCREMGVKLLITDIGDLAENNYEDFTSRIRVIIRESKLQNALIFWSNFDKLLKEDKRILLNAFLQHMDKINELTFLSGNTIWEPGELKGKYSYLRVDFPKPSYSNRVEMWKKSLNNGIKLNSSVDISMLAEKFKLSYGQISDAASTADNLAAYRDSEKNEIKMNDLYDACRLHSNQKLSALAKKIDPTYVWKDIVLNTDSLNQLREICNYVKFRYQVYDDWGFDKKLSMGKGLNALFAGPSGTGKTMAAEIIGNELNLELYKIDLSGVVSKYIGETEKNLAKIFEEAETANSILFFDEADALFGKRTEVRDSHDRYANIEVNYLLQKMEEYEGIVILATNFRKNMDDAFVRRMHFTVEFSLPIANERLKIWKQIWPKETPKDSKLDLGFMANSFEVSGGNIKNIALAAAFLAAADDKKVRMRHLVDATRREYQKMGKVISDNEFGKYTEKYLI